MRKHRAEVERYAPKHRAEVSNKRLALVWSGSIALLAIGMYLHTQQPGEGSSPDTAVPHCNIDFDYTQPIGSSNKRPDVVMNKLGLKAGELQHIDWFPAECATHLSQVAFQQGIVAQPGAFDRTASDQPYPECVVYGTQQEILPQIGNVDRSAVAACPRPQTLVDI